MTSADRMVNNLEFCICCSLVFVSGISPLPILSPCPICFWFVYAFSISVLLILISVFPLDCPYERMKDGSVQELNSGTLWAMSNYVVVWQSCFPFAGFHVIKEMLAVSLWPHAGHLIKEITGFTEIPSTLWCPAGLSFHRKVLAALWRQVWTSQQWR